MAILTFSTEKSSRINGMTYDTDKQELKVTFKRGGEYVYFDVSEEIYNALKTAPSIGKAFNDLVVNAGVIYQKLSK